MVDLDDIAEMNRSIVKVTGVFQSLQRVIAGVAIAGICAVSSGAIWGSGWVRSVEAAIEEHDDRLEVIDELNRTVGRLEGLAAALQRHVDRQRED